MGDLVGDHILLKKIINAIQKLNPVYGYDQGLKCANKIGFNFMRYNSHSVTKVVLFDSPVRFPCGSEKVNARSSF